MSDESCTTIDTPIGPLTLRARGDALVSCRREAGERACTLAPATPALREAVLQLGAYFAGALARFALPLAPGGTPFQRRVWSALARLEPGQTCSYRELAAGLGAPALARAVGAANASNPLWIIVPCHRVVGRGGELRGYAGGLEAKGWLLAHERAFASAASSGRSAA